ncbi:MAG TPA: hypothetical protein VMT11_06865 [Myxococcaceae bacterium]|nr:hypothetical protein [Myxococcaceae bacterium]
MEPRAGRSGAPGALEPGWLDINSTLRWELGYDLPISLVRVVGDLPNPLPRERQGWSD